MYDQYYSLLITILSLLCPLFLCHIKRRLYNIWIVRGNVFVLVIVKLSAGVIQVIVKLLSDRRTTKVTGSTGSTFPWVLTKTYSVTLRLCLVSIVYVAGWLVLS